MSWSKKSRIGPVRREGRSAYAGQTKRAQLAERLDAAESSFAMRHPPILAIQFSQQFENTKTCSGRAAKPAIFQLRNR
jgi:hypothetical protein